MSEKDKLLIFSLSGLRCALPIVSIKRILRAVEISPLPQAPEIVMGLINVQGHVIPVLNIRRLFHLPEIEVNLNDQIVIACTETRHVAILVDCAIAVAEYDVQDIIPSEELFPGIDYLEGVAKLQDYIIYIYSLDRFLSSKDEAMIAPLLSTDMPLPEEEES